METVYRHPLAALRAGMGVSAAKYLQLLAAEHRNLGYGEMAVRREKVARWESGVAAPTRSVQHAMAHLHGVPADIAEGLGWPQWLSVAQDPSSLVNDHAVLHSPWTPAGTVDSTAASAQGGSMDRRGFLIASGSLLASLGGEWSGALDADASTGIHIGRRPLTPVLLDRLEQRLDDLRRLDDTLGGGELRQLASAEFTLLGRLADEAVYDDVVGRRLFSALAEAGRICGWLHFDAGQHAAAQSYYISALRASATAGDTDTGANVLAFMAIQTYSVGDPQDAVNLVRTAQAQTARSSPTVRAMLHMRAGRALSKAGQRKACARELDAARIAFASASAEDVPPWAYWMSAGEIEMIAASSALELDDPQKALDYFAAARDSAYAADGYVRDNALYLVRSADAHLRLGDVDAACAAAGEALDQIDGLDSARPTGALDDFTRALRPYRSARAATDLLARTG